MPHHSAIAVIPRGLAPLTPGLLVVAPTVLVAAMFRPVAVRTWSALLAGTSRLFRHERAAIPMETTGGGTDAFLNGSYGVDRGSPPRGDRQPKHGKIDTPGCPMRPNAYACDANTVSPPSAAALPISDVLGTSMWHGPPRPTWLTQLRPRWCQRTGSGTAGLPPQSSRTGCAASSPRTRSGPSTRTVRLLA
jgi:hypothetical protein